MPDIAGNLPGSRPAIRRWPYARPRDPRKGSGSCAPAIVSPLTDALTAARIVDAAEQAASQHAGVEIAAATGSGVAMRGAP